MTSRAEQFISQTLRTILADLPNGASIANSEQFRDVLSDLEFYLPRVLGEIHQEWRHESLDGILPLVARKIQEGEVELFGECILITDQTLTPIHLRLQISPSEDEISWLELKLGEMGEHGMVRTPYGSLTAMKRVLSLSGGQSDVIEWVYKVTFGERRH